MEDESYRNLVATKLNRTLDRKIGPDDHIDDVVSVVKFSDLAIGFKKRKKKQTA